VGTIIAIAVLVSNHAKQIAGQTDKPIKKADEEKGVAAIAQSLPYWMWIIVGGVGLVACVIIGVSLYFTFKKPSAAKSSSDPSKSRENLAPGESQKYYASLQDGFMAFGEEDNKKFHLHIVVSGKPEMKNLPLELVCVNVLGNNEFDQEDVALFGEGLREHVKGLPSEQINPGLARIINPPPVTAKKSSLLAALKNIILFKGYCPLGTYSNEEEGSIRNQAYLSILSICDDMHFKHVAIPYLGSLQKLELETLKGWFEDNIDSQLTVLLIVPNEATKQSYVDAAAAVFNTPQDKSKETLEVSFSDE
jgi:hypothetical protein